MKIVLVDPAPPSKICEPYEHLGLCYLSSCLTREGHYVRIISSVLESLSISGIINSILAAKPQLIGFSLKECFAARAFKIINGIRSRGCNAPVVLGGHYATFNQFEILRDFSAVNFIVRGEGEYTLNELAAAIDSGNAFESIAGLSFRRNGSIMENPERAKIADLDTLPYPDRSQTPQVLQQGGMIDLSGSRGCYANCSFCSIQSFYKASAGPNYRQRSVKNIVDEIERLVEKFGRHQFKFIDDQFFAPGNRGKQQAREFADELFRRQLKISFQFSCRVSEISRDLMAHLKSAGLSRVFIGVESAHQRGLDTFNKGTTVEQNRRALDTLDSLGINYIVAMILTDAFTTWDELNQNLSFLDQLKPRVARVGGMLSVERRLTPHKGTPIFNTLKNMNRLKGNYKTGYRYVADDVRIRLFLSVWAMLENVCLPVFNYFKMRSKRRKHTLKASFQPT
ncbi:radical SAM protein [candidate division KSB1 bacterium]|nr:radical SAM protein [candidate division KSB1 bacterium]